MTAANSAVTIDEGQTAANTGAFADYDDAVTITVSERSITQSGSMTGAWSWSSLYGDNGSHTIIVTATNADGSTAATSFTVNVNNVAPTATDNHYSLSQGGSLSGNVITDDTGTGADSDPLDDMNNWGRATYMVGEVDTYKKFPDYELYGNFNVNYVKLDQVPDFADWSPIHRALRAGDFFVTTGEILVPEWSVAGNDAARHVVADVEWTFPLEFVEVVWGDGKSTGRQVISATEERPFGNRRFQIPFDATSKK